MKKILTFLWIIIITGTVLITLHVFKPKSDQLENPTTLPQGTTTQINDLGKTPDNSGSTQSAAEYIKIADEALANEDFAKAAENYGYAHEIDPSSMDLTIKLGNAYLTNNQNDKALGIFTEAAKTAPTSIDVQIALGRVALNNREIEKAKTIIWALDAKNNLVKYYRGIILILYKDFTNGKKEFQAIIANDQKPDQELLTKTQKYIDAYQTFSYYKEAEATFLQLLLAKAMTATQEYQAAIPLLYDVINSKNNYRDAWIVLGYCYLNINKPDDAIDALTQAKDLTPQKPETLFYLGLAYFAKNDIDNAINYIQLADKYGYEPKDQINLKLGDLYLLKKDYKKSATNYEIILAQNSSKMDIFVRAVWLNIDQLNNPEKALELSQKALAAHPDEAMSYNLVGWAYTALGDYNNGKENLQKALAMNPNLDAANLNYGWYYEKIGDHLLAKEYYKKAYYLGRSNSVSQLAASRYNNLSNPSASSSPQNYQTNVSSPNSPTYQPIQR